MTSHFKSAWSAALCGALLLGGCTQSEESAPDTAAPVTAVAPSPTTAPAVAPQSRLTATVSKGSATVTLNGRKVGDYPSYIRLDVTPYLQPGENSLAVNWTQPTSGSVKIEYALAATPDKWTDIANVTFYDGDKTVPGNKTLSFNLPNADGTLPLAPAASTTDSAPAADNAAPNSIAAPVNNAAPAPDVATTPLANAAAPTAAPSNGIKALLNASSNDGTFEVFLNDTKVGDFQSHIQIDVGSYLKPGTNRLKVAWTERSSYFNAKLAYFSTAANDYRNLARIQLYTSDTRKPGQREVSFNLPSS